jgi:hypothetical protein
MTYAGLVIDPHLRKVNTSRHGGQQCFCRTYGCGTLEARRVVDGEYWSSKQPANRDRGARTLGAPVAEAHRVAGGGNRGRVLMTVRIPCRLAGRKAAGLRCGVSDLRGWAGPDQLNREPPSAKVMGGSVQGRNPARGQSWHQAVSRWAPIIGSRAPCHPGCRGYQSRGQTADSRGATEMPRSKPGRLPTTPPRTIRISSRGTQYACFFLIKALALPMPAGLDTPADASASAAAHGPYGDRSAAHFFHWTGTSAPSLRPAMSRQRRLAGSSRRRHSASPPGVIVVTRIPPGR